MFLWFATLLVIALSSVNGYATTNKTIGNSVGQNKFKCYVCFWARNDERCGDENFTVAQAEAGHYMINCLACYKQTFFAAKGNKVKILRGCAQSLPHYALRCQYVFNDDNSYMETCACSSQYCNAAFQCKRVPRLFYCLFTMVTTWILIKTYHYNNFQFQ